jgi:replication factor A1
LLDSFGTQIRGTFFREAVDMFYDLIQKDSVYFMSNGRLKAANKQFSSIPNEYEITFDKNSIIQCVVWLGCR